MAKKYVVTLSSEEREQLLRLTQSGKAPARKIKRAHILLKADSRQPEARRLLDKLDLQYTPKHGSWLNMAEIELSVFSRQCLNRRIADDTTFQRLATIWATNAIAQGRLSIGASRQLMRASS
jgi:DDE superfamily endonuclease